jgi:TrmH family RNA methyltransferase
MSERLFLVEGPQAVREALAVTGPAGEACVVEVFATYAAEGRHPDLLETASAVQAPWHAVGGDALAGLADTVNPQGVVAVCRFIDVPLENVIAQRPRLVVVCADVRDPGNAGAVIRCADAAGADAVVLAGASVDPYNGKTVRATVGSLFHLPVVSGQPVDEAVTCLRDGGLTVLAADGDGSLTLDTLDDAALARPTAWLFGNEAWGLPVRHAALADSVVRVPIYGRAESLNLATAAAVCLYASARAQRRGRPDG